MRFVLLVLFVFFVFVGGVCFGIWMDWSKWHPQVGKQDIVYEVPDFPVANVRVHPGDRLSVVSGGSAVGVKMSFNGFNPCVDKSYSDKCVIATTAPTGAYGFSCTSDNGFTCTDPGIQQSPGPPFEDDVSYTGFVKADVLHLVGMQTTPAQKPEETSGTQTAEGARASSSAILAYLSCSSDNSTQLKDQNGNSLQTISANMGTTVYWISPVAFTLSNYSAANLCSPANPTGGGPKAAQCAVSQYKNNATYVVQAQGCGASTDNMNTNQ